MNAMNAMNAASPPIQRLLSACLTACMAACLAACLAACASAVVPAQSIAQPLPRVLLLGEVHDNEAQHALRLQMFKDLLATGARPALLMEQFDHSRQPAIDAALAQPAAGAASAAAPAAAAASASTSADDTAARVIAAAGGPGWRWEFYRPFVALAVVHGLPVVAGNVSRDEARQVMSRGLSALGFDADVPADVSAAHVAAIVQGHCGQLDSRQAAVMALAQEARDQLMARLVERNAARGVLLLAGNGHVRRDVGVPRWLSAATRGRTLSVGLLEAGDGDAAAYDQTVVTAAQPRGDPCAALRGAAPPRP